MAQRTEVIDLNAILATAPGNALIWNRFLAELTWQLNCDSSVLLVTDLIKRENTHFLFSVNIPLGYQKKYEREFNRLDSFNYFISKNPKQIHFNQTLEDEINHGIEKNFKPLSEQRHRIGVSIPCNHNHALSLIVNRKQAFNDAELKKFNQIFQAIISPLEEALHGEQRFKINSQILHYMGEHFDGYIIIDRHLNILFSDPVYTSIISQLDCVTISNDRIQMKNSLMKQQLLTLIELNQEAGSVHNQCHSCQISLIPISSLENLYKWECYKDGFILTFTHDKAKNPSLNRLTEIFQLSRCEAVCALHFMKTPSIPEVASSTYRSQETVRNHIKHTMQKMDVHNQAELMKKLLTLSAL
ncbi:helix-turn-helix transcriptional regulator [Methyloprofundus sp.]|uniref:helix-turn-helix transcriptional regulator n=1 Tax=Methyloprofundus sp. TaxID=2020875 RepID=UPI003D0C2191